MARRVGVEPCEIEGCERKILARGWCSTHYKRWWTTGTTDEPPFGPNRPRPFWEYVEVGEPDECWPFFKNRRTRTGRGVYHIGSKTITGARMAWELTFGPIPAGLLVLHKCDFGPCCNPSHLELGDYFKNNRDAITRGRRKRRQLETHCAKGLHEWSEENVYTSPSGERACRACRSATRKKWRARHEDSRSKPVSGEV